METLEFIPSIGLILCLGLLWGSIFWLRKHGERLPEKIRPSYLPSNTLLFLLSLLLLFWVATRFWGSATGAVGWAILTVGSGVAACIGMYRTMVAEGGFRAFIRRYYGLRIAGLLILPGFMVAYAALGLRGIGREDLALPVGITAGVMIGVGWLILVYSLLRSAWDWVRWWLRGG
ncbi:MAG: hypothetical protein WBH57_09445 [Anaerolineae bacterium]